MFNVVSVQDVEKLFKETLQKELESHTKNALNTQLNTLRTNLRKEVKADVAKMLSDMKAEDEAKKKEEVEKAKAAKPSPAPSSRQLLRRGRKKTAGQKEAEAAAAVEAATAPYNKEADAGNAYMPLKTTEEDSSGVASTDDAGQGARVLVQNMQEEGSGKEGLRASQVALLETETPRIDDLPPSASPKVNEIVSHKYFEPVCGLVVLLNAILIGVDSDFKARYGLDSAPSFLDTLDSVFFVFFTTELILRILARGPADFFLSQPGGAAFDTAMVTFQAIDQMSKLVPASEMAMPGNFSVLRLLRIIRVLRIARALRMLRLFEVLSNTVSSLMASVGPAFWALVLLLVTIYVFAILFLEVVLSAPGGPSEELDYYFGSMGATVLTLFESVVGGVEWEHVVNLLIQNVSPAMGFLFSGYVVVGLFVVMNLVMSVFLDKVTRTVREDKDDTIKERVASIFAENEVAVEDADNLEISWEQFAEKLKKPALQEYFRSIDIEPTESEARGLFDLLDVDGGGALTAEEIVSGCLRLRGPARALEVSLVLRDIAHIHTVSEKVAQVHTNLGSLSTTMTAIQAKLDKALPDEEVLEEMTATEALAATEAASP
eukprot:TRINITY_DN13325_c0_g1_i1.p1 TRINITY_DN13325_c0_g1~~TRINITY_DN13325_c0_g1_i1.p1  ORF type:complete len:643 (+),score=163.30 TRINITY_DN13325_c0_g1_i1:121-1929(+)